MNPKDFFLSLSKETHPYGYEDELLDYLPELIQDEFGNYYTIIGDNPKTMFTAHLDTADYMKSKVNHVLRTENGEDFIHTDGKTILGADDKAGVTVLVYMIKNNIEGLYYFFIGEEVGRIGSKELAKYYDEFVYLDNIKSCVSFDRRGTTSVITHQSGFRCCSDEYATALANELNESGLSLSLDNTGIYTDSYSLINRIQECTNISVGYRNEHTQREYLNVTYLTKLCEAVLNVNWENLPIKRKLNKTINMF